MIGPESAGRRRALSRRTFAILCFLALATRIPAALVFPNPEQDGYSYVETISRLTSSLSAGTFRLADLFDFWLPLYQFIAAIVNLWAHDPLLVGKLLSAGSGAASCVLVFAVTWELTSKLWAAWLGFLLILCNPLHILYSAASMTDVPHACFILASLHTALRRRWIAAAICMAIAEAIRVEAWVFVLVLPLLQFAYERRVSPLLLLILILPPACSVGICYLATGNPLAIFARREAYIQSYLDFVPSRRGFTWEDVQRDVVYYSLGSNWVIQSVMLCCGSWMAWRLIRRGRVQTSAVIVIVYFFALLGFLFIAYVSRRQPVLYPRYGLLFFVLGIPLLAWIVSNLGNIFHLPAFRVLVAAGLILCCVKASTRQFAVVHSSMENARHEAAIARELQWNVSRDPVPHAVFCDHVSVRVLSALPPQQFLRTAAVPAAAAKSRQTFENYLKETNVHYLVFAEIENSLPPKLLPELARTAARALPEFERVDHQTLVGAAEISLYRFQPVQPK